ncbi:MAG: YdcF family protein [Chitinophagaceae bacterium]|nr:MAG: YdcF family protein [Chitinophagaceae bacterium]
MITSEVFELAQLLWNYHQLHHPLQKADCIFVLGSHDTRVAERAAELYLQGWAPLIVMSGGLGRLTKESWTASEASLFARIAMQKGVPADAILVEDKSTNTGENILFTQQLLKQHGLDPEHFILVQKPYMERRSFATFEKQWPGKKLTVTSPQIEFKNYPTADLPMDRVIQIMVGDLQRIKIYAEKGFQIYQEIPETVWQAYEKLVALGYNQQLVK